MESAREALRDSLLGWSGVEALDEASLEEPLRRRGDEGRFPEEDLRNRSIVRVRWWLEMDAARCEIGDVWKSGRVRRSRSALRVGCVKKRKKEKKIPQAQVKEGA